jgi:SagB-type dehydrogenase family enzyme
MRYAVEPGGAPVVKSVDRSAGNVDTVRAYHVQTAITLRQEDWERSRLLKGFRSRDLLNWPDPFKRYPAARTVSLVADAPDSAARATDVLSAIARVPPEPYGLAWLSRLLFFMDGVTRVYPREDLGVQMYTRAAPSAGNLHPVDVYVVTGGLPDLEPGVYHVAPLAFALEQLRRGDLRSVVAAGLGDASLADSPLFLILTGIPFRTGWKYAERGWRHLYWDGGTMLANGLALVEASGHQAPLYLGFMDEELRTLLGLDGVQEHPLAVVRLPGQSEPAPAVRTVDRLDLESTAIAPAPVEFSLLTEAQRASDLTKAASVATWRTCTIAAGSSVAVANIRVPPSTSGETLETVILRRGSTRLMRHAQLPRHLLDWPMAVATRPVAADFISGNSLLQHVVAVHAVEGLTPGFYRWRAGTLTPILTADEDTIRRRSRFLCGQHLGGDSGYTVFHCADLARLLEEAHARSYRAVQLEAGIVAGRLGLAAFALGAGATELTFMDDEIAAFLELDCILVTTVGVPAYRNKMGGRPGKPTRLTGMPALQRRMDELAVDARFTESKNQNE